MEDIIGELRGAFDRRDWIKIATTLATAGDEQQKAQGYEWLRSILSSAVRDPEAGASLIASLLAPLAGLGRAKLIQLGRSDDHDRRWISLGEDGVLREYVAVDDDQTEYAWVLLEARCTYGGVVVPDTWAVAHKTNDINEKEVFLEGEDGSFWRLGYGGQWRVRWVLGRWPYSEGFTLPKSRPPQ